jgi:hypothetical protein
MSHLGRPKGVEEKYHLSLQNNHILGVPFSLFDYAWRRGAAAAAEGSSMKYY